MSVFDGRNFSQEVYDLVLERILNGIYKPGEKLNLNVLQKELSISRSPIKDALNKLHGAGIIDISPQQGHYVHSVSPEELQDLFEFRLLIESDASKKAAKKFNPDDFIRLKKIIDEARAVSESSDLMDVIRFFSLDHAFHLEIVKMAGNAVVTKAYSEAHVHLHNYSTQFIDIRKRASQVCEEHLDILNALQAGDAGRVDECIGRHIEAVRKMHKELWRLFPHASK